ncbi:MAG: Fe-S cluster assembly protein SufD [Bauldia sp.]|uniref:Fe-S cluster assembly protein SufD n=1 Tax=Bauldia sp. TaxID=2575872 RepID=UPI001D20BEB5|nr:Fe-S cluster assembly protein SufD [Bauldia sp.]MCB1495307.1 Fe-S cluster assembly protein SufD [Bauldia sp.]
MTAEPRTVRTKAEETLAAEFAAARDALPGGERVRERRDAAFSLFERFGLPHRRVEAWKYTDLRALLRTAAPLAGPATPDLLAPVAEDDPIAGLDRAQLVVANGVYRPELSDLDGVEGVTVEALADVAKNAPDRIGRLFEDSDDVVMALNTALFAGGVYVKVAADAKPARPLEVVYLTAAAEPVSVVCRSVVEVGANASMRLIESFRGPAGIAYQVNALTELDIGLGAKVTWSRVQTESEAAQHLASFVARVAGNATLDHLAVNRGAALSRWQGFVMIEGRGARTGFYGATMLAGTEHGDNALVVRHVAPDSTSTELFKNVVDGRATGAFQGMIAVERDAQKTDAKMMTRALLLSDEAQFASKPELEIFADDVRCGHGATAGDIDQTMLFYLMSRGLPRKEAERLLIESFLDEAIDAIDDEPVAEALKGIVSGWLERRGAAT